MNFTLSVTGLDPLVQALHALAQALRPVPGVLLHADRPDAGTDVPLALLQPAAAVTPALPAFVTAFTPPGGAAALSPPPTAPPIAVAAAPPTAPAVPLASLTAAPPAAPMLAPPPAPAAPALPALAAPSIPASSAGTVDTSGLPWDARIHAANKATNQNGTWRQKRGTADTYVKQVEALLRGAVVANVAAAMLTPPSSPAVPSASAALPPPPPPAAPRVMLFGELAMKFQGALLAGNLTMEQLNGAVASHGLQQFNQLMHAPAVVPAVDAALSALLGVAPGLQA